MARVMLEIDTQRYPMLKSAAEDHQVSLGEACRRRLGGNE
jgi:hypothetical protein